MSLELSLCDGCYFTQVPQVIPWIVQQRHRSQLLWVETCMCVKDISRSMKGSGSQSLSECLPLW